MTSNRSPGAGDIILRMRRAMSGLAARSSLSGMAPCRTAAQSLPYEGIDVFDTSSSRVMPALKMSASGPSLFSDSSSGAR